MLYMLDSSITLGLSITFECACCLVVELRAGFARGSSAPHAPGAPRSTPHVLAQHAQRQRSVQRHTVRQCVLVQFEAAVVQRHVRAGGDVALPQLRAVGDPGWG